MIKALSVSGFLLLGGLVILPAIAVTPATATDFSKPGPFAIGVQKFKISDVTNEHPLDTWVWYPAAGPAPDPAILKSTPDASPATTGPSTCGPSPGTSMPGMAYDRWGQLLATYGFVVLLRAMVKGAMATKASTPCGQRDSRNWLRRHAVGLGRPSWLDSLIPPASVSGGIRRWNNCAPGGGCSVDFKALGAWCAANEAENLVTPVSSSGSKKTIAPLYGVADRLRSPCHPIGITAWRLWSSQLQAVDCRYSARRASRRSKCRRS